MIYLGYVPSFVMGMTELCCAVLLPMCKGCLQMAEVGAVNITNRLDGAACRLSGALILVGLYSQLPQITGTVDGWGREYDQPDLRGLGFKVCSQVRSLLLGGLCMWV